MHTYIIYFFLFVSVCLVSNDQWCEECCACLAHKRGKFKACKERTNVCFVVRTLFRRRDRKTQFELSAQKGARRNRKLIREPGRHSVRVCACVKYK